MQTVKTKSTGEYAHSDFLYSAISYSVKRFRKRTAKVMISLRGCTVRAESSLSTYMCSPKAHFHMTTFISYGRPKGSNATVPLHCALRFNSALIILYQCSA